MASNIKHNHRERIELDTETGVREADMMFSIVERTDEYGDEFYDWEDLHLYYVDGAERGEPVQDDVFLRNENKIVRRASEVVENL